MSTSDSPQFVSRSALKVLSGTLLSRVTGLLRDMAMAYAFGAAAPLAAFLLAFRFVYLLRRLFGEGLLHQGFIPKFEEIRAVDPKGSALFFRDLFWTLTCALLVIVLIGEGVLFQLRGEVGQLGRLMLPGMIFLCLFGLTSGLLNTEKSFFLPAASPASFNLVWIVGVVSLARLPIHSAVQGLSLIITLAFLLQFGLTLPRTIRFLRAHLSLRQLFTFRPFSKKLKGLSTPLLLGVLGVAAVQVNSAVDGVFARFAAPEGPAYLWYAIRMQQLPLALFGLALSSALLPSLARCFEKGDRSGFQALVDSSANKIFLLMLPCTIGIFVLGAASVNLLFGRGGFDEIATAQTTLCLWGYGAGLLPMALTQILAPAYYAQKDYKTPAMGFVYSSILNIALNTLLVFGFHLGSASIALATTGAAVFNVLYLRRKLAVQSSISMRYIGIVASSAVLTGLLGYFILGDTTIGLILGHPEFTRSASAQLLQLGVGVFTFFGLIALQGRFFMRPYFNKFLRAVLSK